MRLTKHHGLGNDFLVALLDEVPAAAPDLARHLCDRRRGVGADGLVFGTPGRDAEVAFRLFNADGSVAEVSGNGLRCFAQALALDRGSTALELDVDTLAGVRRISLRPTDDPLVAQATVEMGQVGPGAGLLDGWDRVPGLPEVRRAASADIGNPHLVIEVDDPSRAQLAVLGPAIEEIYGGINVHVIAPGPDPDTVVMRTWERGAGITEACGSGACVAAARAHEWGLASSPVTVRMPGGDAIVELGSGVRLTGPTTFVATIEVPHA